MSTLPKVDFRVSWIYNKNWEEWIKLYPKLEGRAAPTFDEVWKRKDGLEAEWRKVEDQILKEISELTHLDWQSDEILCYLTGNSLAFSEPLTIPVSDLSDDRLVDILTHELFHIIFVVEKGDYLRLKDYWPHLHEKYKDETFNTKIHLSVHAFHKALILKLFDESKWEREKSVAMRYPDYKKSIEIVEQEGHENIIKEFVDRVR